MPFSMTQVDVAASGIESKDATSMTGRRPRVQEIAEGEIFSKIILLPFWAKPNWLVIWSLAVPLTPGPPEALIPKSQTFEGLAIFNFVIFIQLSAIWYQQCQIDLFL